MIFRNSYKNTAQSLPALQNDAAWQAYLSGKGYCVSAKTALRVSAVIRCVDVVAKTMASLPLNLFYDAENGKEKATKHPIYKLLYRLPNPETTAYEFWHMYIFNLMLTTGAYAKIARDKNGFIRALWNIPTANVVAHRNVLNNERYIDVYMTNGKTERLRDGEYMFTPGLRFTDGSDPEDAVRIAADVLGLTMALNGFAKGYFENGTNIGGIVESPNALSDTAYERFKESWYASYSGVINQHKVAFLEDGAKFTQIGQKPSDSQALESRKFEVIEICRIFGVPPHKVFELDRATFSNIEEMNTEFVEEALAPMSVRLEQTIYKDLLTTAEQAKYYAKFNVNGLLRGNIAARTAYYHNARQDGWMNSDDIRELEDMNRLPAGQGGDIYAVNGNMIPLSAIPLNLPKGAAK